MHELSKHWQIKGPNTLDDSSTEINILAMAHYLLFGTGSQLEYAIAEQLLYKMKNTFNILFFSHHQSFLSILLESMPILLIYYLQDMLLESYIN